MPYAEFKGSLSERKPDGKTAAPVGLAINLKPSAVGHNQVVSDGQPQAHTLGKTLTSMAAIEGLKDVSLICGGNANAGVADHNGDTIIFGLGFDGFTHHNLGGDHHFRSVNQYFNHGA